MEIFVLVLSFVTTALPALGNEQLETGICLTPECIVAAADIIKRMDTRINPCDDFYEFACGQYIKNTIIPKEEPYKLVLLSSTNTVNQHLQDILNTLQANETKPFSLLKELYGECLNITKIEEGSLGDFMEILASVGGWPVLNREGWKENDMDWVEMTRVLRKLGYQVNYLISLDVKTDPQNSTGYILTIDEPSLTVDNAILNKTSNKMVEAYFRYMVDVAVALGASEDVSVEDLRESLEFERKLAKISFSDLNHLYPYIDWKEYVNNMLKSTNNKVNNEDIVNVINHQYLTDLSSLLKNTPNRTIINYLIWRVVDSSIPYLTQKLRDKRHALERVLYGNSKIQRRRRVCANVVAKKLSSALGALYVQKHFDNAAKKITETVAKNIQDAYAHMLRNTEWMNSETKHEALEKLKNMQVLIGCSNKDLQDYYSELQLDKKSYLRSILSVNLFSMDRSFKQLGKRVNNTECSEIKPYFMLSPVYIPEGNVIQIPATFLKVTYFNKGYPHYINYGSIGWVLGHEIIHGFDNVGHMYDKNGNVKNYWNTQNNFLLEESAKCLINQYSKYTILQLNGTHVNGNLTIGENIADNGGIKSAYLAYQSWVERNSPEPSLPGLNYTANQLFWISAANLWCGKFRTEFANTNVLQDTHSLPRFRVIGSFSNLDFFSRDFNCPLGSKMNPEDKCHIW